MPGTLRTPPAQPRVPDQSGDLYRSPPGTLRLSPPSPSALRATAPRSGPTPPPPAQTLSLRAPHTPPRAKPLPQRTGSPTARSTPPFSPNTPLHDPKILSSDFPNVSPIRLLSDTAKIQRITVSSLRLTKFGPATPTNDSRTAKLVPIRILTSTSSLKRTEWTFRSGRTDHPAGDRRRGPGGR